MSCSAVSCSSRTTKGGVKDPGLSFHSFPKRPEIRSEWIKSVRRDNWEPTKYSRMCSKHFEETSFITGLHIKKLKSDAIPTIFIECPSYYQPVVKKRKAPQHRDEIQCPITPRKRKKFEESGVNMEDMPTTPRRAVKVLASLARSRTVALRRLRTVKKLREKKRRLEKNNANLLNIISDLTDKNLIETESSDLLRSIGDNNQDLLVRLKRKHSKEPLPQKYSPKLRKFALSLHFLSPRAYKYVRENFDSCLPHPKTISKWYQAVDCNPGFTKESFDALKIKSEKQPVIGTTAKSTAKMYMK